MDNKRIEKSLIANILIFIMVVLGTIFMFTGFEFMASTSVLSTSGLALLKYYTVDSNILVGIASLFMIVYEYWLIKKKIKNIPKYVYVLKYIGTVGVTLTFCVTLFYLAPALGDKLWFLYQNANLFFHLLVPILSFISFVFLEKTTLDFKYTFYGISTMIIYGLFYLGNVLIHQENGKVLSKYDWYGFVRGGAFSIVIVFLIVLIITYFISFIILKLNKSKKELNI